MMTVSSTKCKTRFGEYLDIVRDEPVIIEKTGRSVAVLISWREYERLTALENAYWLKRAKEAEKSGYVGKTKSMKILKAGLNAKARPNQ
jgi:prevent-host-death family protein